MTIKTLIAAATAVLLLSTPAHAVVEDGHWTLNGPLQAGYGSALGTNFNLSVDQTQDGDYTGVFLTYDQGLLTGVSLNTDQGADIFVVQPGLAFDKAAALEPSLTQFLIGPSIQAPFDGARHIDSVGTVNVGQDFYLGVQTRAVIYNDFTVFGWAHFKTDSTGAIQMVDSAMAYGEAGIVIGTRQALAVPEASTMSLMSMGLIGLALATRRRARGVSA